MHAEADSRQQGIASFSRMSENMVQELERLRKLLDNTSPEQLKRNLTRAASGSDTAFSGALSAAEVTTSAD